jgi:hypothetical protein
LGISKWFSFSGGENNFLFSGDFVDFQLALPIFGWWSWGLIDLYDGLMRIVGAYCIRPRPVISQRQKAFAPRQGLNTYSVREWAKNIFY